MNTDRSPNQQLSCFERGVIFVVGIAALAIALTITFYPLSRVKEERDGKGVVLKSTAEQSDQKELSLLLAASSLILFFWGMNGLRLAKLTVGSVSAEAKANEVKAAEDYAKREQLPTEVIVADKPPEAVNEAPAEDKGSVFINDETESVYSLSAVPRDLLDDLFQHWPAECQKPKDYSSFEFASKRKGKGNHPWTVKFKDLPAFKISYGGQGKDAATVSVPG